MCRLILIVMIFAGLKNCGINVHQLIHLTYYVKCFGPLWTQSAFGFEGQMQTFLRHSHATHGIDKQVCACMYIFMHARCIYPLEIKKKIVVCLTYSHTKHHVTLHIGMASHCLLSVTCMWPVYRMQRDRNKSPISLEYS